MTGALTNLLVSAALLLGMYLAMRLLRRLFRKFARRHDYGPGRVFQVQALSNALFASWSILSNLTAGLILFFGAPFRIADRVRVLDGDNTVTGRVVQMGLIYLGLEDDDGHFYTLPNNVLLQKTVIRLKSGKEVPVDKKHCR